ncbi:hypothetical protein [Turneriella parva]|uniref:Lipoprotein n=1 Tax=Turneriella parva (strain ATCC BAA-1111 / DSM 21527 / NCTC 11395 / H) TaxID=869212 RepID=I4B6H5_TURPD|nr:hypothetical protein [Turneriella parva]AFM12882.1 hypothetical protein Turpa_2237 [Turneriella parva DSM 21527]
MRYPAIYLLALLTFSCTIGTYNLQDDAYYQNNQAGSRNHGVSHGIPTGNVATGSVVLTAATAAPEIVRDALKRSESARSRKQLCADLLRRAQAPDSAAYDWQSWYNRCGS